MDWADDDDDWEEGRFDDADEDDAVGGGYDKLPIDPTNASEMEQVRRARAPHLLRTPARARPPRPARAAVPSRDGRVDGAADGAAQADGPGGAAARG